MTDLVPADEPISREALERIIRRATELQAGEREMGDNLTEAEVLALGQEVGLPARFVRQAVLEERGRALRAPTAGLQRFMGAATVTAVRTVPGEGPEVEAALDRWMTQSELLSVKRRYPDRTSWEPRSDLGATLRRSLGGRRYVLARAGEVVGQVTTLEPGWCYVTLTANLSSNRNAYLAGSAGTAVIGGTTTTVALVLGTMAPVAVLPAGLGIAIAVAILRSRRTVVDRVQVALEQILDSLERGELRSGRSSPPGTPGALLTNLRDEVRKHLGYLDS